MVAGLVEHVGGWVIRKMDHKIVWRLEPAT